MSTVNRRIFYLMSGAAHLPYLVASLRSLRKHWAGPVDIWAWDESHAIVSEIAKDRSLEISNVYRENPAYRGKNDQFLHKIRIAKDRYTFDKNLLYLDADTIINGDLNPLFESSEIEGFCATQFCSWNTTGGVIKNRIGRLVGKVGIDQVLVKRLLEESHPSINGGVFVTKPDSIMLKDWEEWTQKVLNIFIADETVLHVAMLKHVESAPRSCKVWAGGAYNCSPKYQPKYLNEKEVKIWHFHGDSNVRPDKTQKGYDLWWPEYQDCIRQNVGNIQDWIGTISNKWMVKLPNSLVNGATNDQ